MNDRTGADGRACPNDEQAVAFALHALEPDEELAMRTHIEGCHSCRATVHETEVVMGTLAGTVDQVDPPAQLRDNILATAAQTPQADPRPEPEPEPGPGPAGELSGARAGSQSSPTARWTRGRRALVAAAAAVLIGVAGLAGYTVQLHQQRDALAAQAQAMAAVVTQLGRPGSAHATLVAPDGRPVGALLVTADERMVLTHGLAPNDRSDSVYVAWGLGAGDPRPLGTFDVTTSGPALHDVGAASGDPFAQYAVSLEPGRAMPAAPSDVVASGPVQT